MKPEARRVMRKATWICLSAALVAALPFGCGSEEEGPLFPGASGTEGQGGAGGPGGMGGEGGEGGAGGQGGEGGAGGGSTCTPSMGATACDACVYDQCCAAAIACDEGTPCDALWDCARAAGCLSPTEDFDGCAVEACPMEATTEAVSALESLAGCIRTSCGETCG
ncbi:hypothetical protein [Polyangium sp. 6x1]|uniref:hypothetical protein n=1 Tax=Polyangium sp. 6x1 TaxID=3042689 RepID=UPI002482D7C9|nr:hypothetical protein [Polyangium sp. 6x1]MDI1445345.1 hypothetical protein [Polyangium sp. 6x1]